jgi:NAD(P)-dependent dehydrogenase (short-subunit alcohol dehydrogenase family)
MSNHDQHAPGTGLLEGKAVAIIGASRGIGAAAAHVFAREGASLMLGAREQPRLAELTESLRASGTEVEYARCDIGSAGDTCAIVAASVERFGRLDGAFNNAGISGGGHGRLADLPEEHFDELCRINFKGVWLAMRAEIPAMLRNPHAGAIVNTSSVGGVRGGPDLSAYPATKRAVIGLTTTAAHDYGRDGLRVNAIAPGTTDTDMITAWKRRDPTIAERLDAATPLGRGGQPDEIAQAAAWLLSDRASYVSGAVLTVDGGMTA